MRLVRLLFPLLLTGVSLAQPAPDTEKIWKDYLEWFLPQRDIAKLGTDKYRATLIEGGMTAAQADERLAILGKLFPEHRSELMGLYMNKLYTSPKQTRFVLEPNRFLVLTAKGLKPGKALDVAMGQGRNAVHLATQGWDVTGFDVADQGMQVANENAAKAGARIHTVHATFEEFDYGKEEWDLIYFIYTDAPIMEPKFIERVCAALKPGGYLLIDRPFYDLDHPDPDWGAPLVEQDKPNALLKAYSNLRVVHYQDTMEVGDWQQTRVKREEKLLRIVRMLAKKS